MFKENLKTIIDNLPLTLSDSTDPKDASINRCMLWIEFLIIFFVSPPTIAAAYFFSPGLCTILVDMWTKGLAAFGVHFTANVIKRFAKQAQEG